MHVYSEITCCYMMQRNKMSVSKCDNIIHEGYSTLVNVNAPVVATTSWWLHFFSTGGGVKG